ncbi:TIGR04104 family putative zinc finger protein [Salibacterium aidingense]|uniref:TIGR04104 family putative zinc finger protein n=1 Tax=Salibacterium aidingense TaxID=384933 RepID=UPI003BE18472
MEGEKSIRIQNCLTCNKQFSGREIGRSTANLFSRPKIECCNCGEEYKITPCSYILSILLRPIPLLVVYFLLKFDFSNGSSITIFLVITVFIFFIEPFLAEYKKMINESS